MKKLLSLPPNLVSYFHEMEHVSPQEYFCTSDPVDSKLGSGGGTAWLLQSCHQQWGGQTPFVEWLAQEKRILIHAGGQSRRLPAYAPSGKVLTPIPVFRWARGQRLGQNLLELQLPLYERIMEKAPSGLHTMIVSGDVLIRAGKLQDIPQADVVCYGIWADRTLASHHGVFVSSRQNPTQLDYMLQKPSPSELGHLLQTHLFLMDIGIWLLSDRAVERLLRKSQHTDGSVGYYDLYSDFGCALGLHPSAPDPQLADLSVAILPLQDGQFYHYGTSPEMISSTVAIQNLVYDQRAIMHLDVKPHPSIFVQNAEIRPVLRPQNENVWIENSYLGEGWSLEHHHIITGIPHNDWQVALRAGTCVDVIPVGEKEYALRPYGFHDAFRGALGTEGVTWMDLPTDQWLGQRGFTAGDIEGSQDMQSARLFPVSSSIEELGRLLLFMTDNPSDTDAREQWLRGPRLSADELSARANLSRLALQRKGFMRGAWTAVARNHRQSVFYQLNLDDAAREFAELDLPEPEPLPDSEPLLKRISDQMFRSQLHRRQGQDGQEEEAQAFRLLRQGLTASVMDHPQNPVLAVCQDQIVWGRSPVRIDLAGGWSDTPPYCLTNGGSVVNIAIELNGQPPLQVFVKPSSQYKIILRSIDLGAIEEISTIEQLTDVARVGSPFSIPKCALMLAGFAPGFGILQGQTLQDRLRHFGCGIELTLLSAIPAGSGLGTSSILAATVLGALSDFCSLGWDQAEISNRTLVLEQLLTTGGGWQDQYGGVLPGAKLLQTLPGFAQTPQVHFLPDTLFTDPQYTPCHLLYYTGLTRTAKHILADIVRGMFLFRTEQLHLLGQMKEHAQDLYEAVTQNRFSLMGALVRKTWQQNQLLDSGTCPPAIAALTQLVDDLCLGYKLPGAGGGGYLYMIAKDPEAATRIRQILTEQKPNPRARFVEMTLSRTGLQVSRS